jgi:hypothetical protein
MRKGKGYRDPRNATRIDYDVKVHDKPAQDSNRLRGDGNRFVSSTWAKDPWQSGDLLVENGSDPSVKAGTVTYCTPDQRHALTDDRHATSAGHIQPYERPELAGLGWGHFDSWSTWTAAGRAILKDQVSAME